MKTKFTISLIIKLGLITAIALSIVACATTGVVGEVNPEASDKEKAELIEVQSKSLAKKVVIKSFRTKMVNDLLMAQVEIANQFSSTQDFQYKFAWYDASGFEVESEGEAWTPIVLHGGAVKSLQAVAPNPTVKKFKIVIRKL